MFFTMATQAAGVGVLLRHRRETNNLGHIPAAFYVSGSGAVTGFAAVPVMQRSLEMRRVFEVLLVQVFMTGFADVHSEVLGCFLRGRRAAVFLRYGKGGSKHGDQQDRQRRRSQELPTRFACRHGRTPRVAASGPGIPLSNWIQQTALAGFHLVQAQPI